MRPGNAIKFGALFERSIRAALGQADVVYDPARDLARPEGCWHQRRLMQLYEAYSGTLYYDSKKFPQFRESSQRDYLRRTLEAAHALDMQVWLWAADKGRRWPVHL
jgi:hypothetical protein